MNGLCKHLIQHISFFLPPTSKVYLAMTCKDIYKKSELTKQNDVINISRYGPTISAALKYDDSFMLCSILYLEGLSRDFHIDTFLDAEERNATYCMYVLIKFGFVNAYSVATRRIERKHKKRKTQ